MIQNYIETLETTGNLAKIQNHFEMSNIISTTMIQNYENLRFSLAWNDTHGVTRDYKCLTNEEAQAMLLDITIINIINSTGSTMTISFFFIILATINTIVKEINF